MFLEKVRALVGDEEAIGFVIVDHGSRRSESNKLLEDVAALFGELAGAPIVEPAHMELAEPSIATALSRCVEHGARLVVVVPYFLGPGRHWNEDIPRLTAEAAAEHTGVRHLVAAPLGLHEAIVSVMQDRVTHCLEHALRGGDACDLCSDKGGCRIVGDSAGAVQ